MEIINILLYIIVIGIILMIIYWIIKKFKENNRTYYEIRYAKLTGIFEKENKKMREKDIDIIFIGDSLIYHYDLKQYFPEFITLNRGIGGDKTFGLEKRLNVSCFDVKSKIVVMLIGINNVKTMFENYESILIKFKEKINDRKIILCSLTPLGGKRAKKIKNKLIILNNEHIKELAKKYNFIYIDLFTPLLNKETNEIYKQYTKDGLHFTMEGYKAITKEIKNVLNKIIS